MPQVTHFPRMPRWSWPHFIPPINRPDFNTVRTKAAPLSVKPFSEPEEKKEPEEYKKPKEHKDKKYF